MRSWGLNHKNTMMSKEVSPILELETQLVDAETKWDFLYASKIITDILSFYQSQNDSKKITVYKKKLKEVNLKAIPNFQHATTSVEIKNEEMEGFIKFFLESSDTNILIKKIADNFTIKTETIRKNMTENTPVFLQICSISSMDHKWNIVKWSSDTDTFWFNRNYNIHQSMNWNHLSILLNRLFKDNLLDQKIIEQYFLKKFIFPSVSSFTKFNVGLDRYFNWDFVSCIHILTPLFEEVLLYVCSLLWIDVISLNRPKKGKKEISTQDKTLWTDIVMWTEFINHRWKDIATQINFILFDSLGFKFRHKIAHWEILFGECNFQNCNLILLLFFIIGSRLTIKSS